MCYQQLDESICEVWNPKEICQRQRTQHTSIRHLFRNEFKKFAEERRLYHATSSLECPHSNGAGERAVQTTKRILKKAAAENKGPFEGLIKYRNTPFEDIGVFPA